MEIITLPITSVRTDGGTQARATLNEETVADYADLFRDGTQFPPVVTFYDGTEYWLADGFHRCAAAKAAHQIEIAAEVKQGTARDAVLYSVSANASHGLRRTTADKQRAIEMLLRDPEWCGWSDTEIGRRVSVDHKTVKTRRVALEATREIPKMEVRKTADGRSMDITNIGPRKPSEPAIQRMPTPTVPSVLVIGDQLVPTAAFTGDYGQDDEGDEEIASITPASSLTTQQTDLIVSRQSVLPDSHILQPALVIPVQQAVVAGVDTTAYAYAAAALELARQTTRVAQERLDTLQDKIFAQGLEAFPTINLEQVRNTAELFVESPAFKAQAGFIAMGIKVNVGEVKEEE